MSEGVGEGVAAASRPGPRTYGIERLGALSDGVFAIALTLLVLDLKIPEVAAGQEQVLGADLLDQIPNLAAWLVSFALLARFWAIHHDVLSALSECHMGTIAVNFVVLALASLVPFATALIGTYEFEVVPLAIFSATIAATALSVGLFSRYVEGHPRRRAGAEPQLRWHWRYNSFAVPLFALFAVGLSVAAHPIAALGAWLVEPLVALGLLYRRR